MPKVSNILIILAGVIILGLLIFYQPSKLADSNLVFKTVESSGSVGKGFNSGHTERKNYVLRNQNDWELIWNQHTLNTGPKPDVPVIDFDKEMVIAVFAGEFPTGGYNIEIQEIKDSARMVKVRIQEISPSENCFVSQAFTQPFHIIKLEKIDKTVDFAIEKITEDC